MACGQNRRFGKDWRFRKRPSVAPTCQRIATKQLRALRRPGDTRACGRIVPTLVPKREVTRMQASNPTTSAVSVGRKPPTMRSTSLAHPPPLLPAPERRADAALARPDARAGPRRSGRVPSQRYAELTLLQRAVERLGGPEAAPIVTHMQQEWGNVGLLCSDGLTKHVPDSRIRERLLAMTSAKQVCEDLLRDALDAGGTDNITVLVGRTLRKDPS